MMTTRKLTFKKGKGFLQEAKFTHKGKRYFWGIANSGYNHVFIYTDFNVVRELTNEEYRQLCQELNIHN